MVKSLKRALEILHILGGENKKYSLGEISELSGLPASTVHRLLSTLKSERFVVQDELSSLYYLGPVLIPLGIKASNYIHLRELALPIMKKLSEKTEEDSYLTVSDNIKGVFIEHVSGQHHLKIVDPFGIEVPLHCGASKKVLLANKSDDFLNTYIKKELVKYTGNTCVNPDLLIEQLKKIKKDGYALTIGEYINDAVGIAAPVKDRFANTVASLGIIGPYSRLTEDKHSNLIASVVEYAEKLSLDLGYYKNTFRD